VEINNARAYAAVLNDTATASQRVAQSVPDNVGAAPAISYADTVSLSAEALQLSAAGDEPVDTIQKELPGWPPVLPPPPKEPEPKSTPVEPLEPDAEVIPSDRSV
jgi:hypothetical protein